MFKKKESSIKIKKWIKYIPFVIFFTQCLYFNSPHHTSQYVWLWNSGCKIDDTLQNSSWFTTSSKDVIYGFTFCYYDTIVLYALKTKANGISGFSIYKGYYEK